MIKAEADEGLKPDFESKVLIQWIYKSILEAAPNLPSDSPLTRQTLSMFIAQYQKQSRSPEHAVFQMLLRLQKVLIPNQAFSEEDFLRFVWRPAELGIDTVVREQRPDKSSYGFGIQ